MSYYTNTNSEVLFNGPQSAYPAAAAAATTAQSLQTTASADAVQAYIPAYWWTQGRRNQALMLKMAGLLQVSTTATTITMAAGSTSTGGGVITGTLVPWWTGPALVVASATTNFQWQLDLEINTQNVGWGTTTISTQVLCTGRFTVGISTGASAASVYQTTQLNPSTIDNSVNNYIYGSVTFSTSSASNTMTMNMVKLYGEN
jgi:hypothetical protein